MQRTRWAWSGIGILSVFWLIYGELDVGAICLYCTGVHLVTFALLVLTAISSIVMIDGPGDDAGNDDPAGDARTPRADAALR